METIPFSPETSEEMLGAVPAKPAVFALYGHDAAAEPYVSKTGDLRRRLRRLLNPPQEQSKRLNLRERVARISYSLTGSDFESWLLLYQTLRALFPQKYRQRIKLAAPAMIRITLENEYPRAYVTNRLGRVGGPKTGAARKDLLYGPFPSRSAAEKYMNDSLDLFKLRRCVDDLHPDPAFPGCIYSEMKMCLAPCFKGCSDEEYATETARVTAYFNSHGASLQEELAAQRERASEHLEFENAAALHARLEKAGKVSALAPELVHRIEELDALIIQPAGIPEHVALFRVGGGMIHGPVLFCVSGMQHPNPTAGSTSLFAHPHIAEAIPEAPGTKPSTIQTPMAKAPMTKPHASLESRIQECLAGLAPLRPRSAAELAEHLSLLKRWYYKSPRFRIGEIFFASGTDLPWRRIVRGVSRVYRGEKEQPESTQGPQPAPLAT